MKTLIKRPSRTFPRYRYILLGLCFIIGLILIYKVKSFSWEAVGLSAPYPFKYPYFRDEGLPASVFIGENRAVIIIEVKPRIALIQQGKNGNLHLDIKNNSLLNPVTLLKVQQITRELHPAGHADINRVVSLFTLSAQGITNVLPKTEEERGILKEQILNNPLIYGQIVSRDLKAAIIQVDFYPNPPAYHIFNILQEIRKKYSDANHNIYISGQAAIRGWLNIYLPLMGSLFIITALAISLILYSFFKPEDGRQAG